MTLVAAGQNCVVPPAAEAGLRWAADHPDVFTAHLTGGDVYLRLGCLDEAHHEYRSAREALADRPASEAKELLIAEPGS